MPLKTSESIMQTKYEICISRMQVILPQIKYINEFIRSYSLENKYFCKKYLFGGLFAVASLLNW